VIDAYPLLSCGDAERLCPELAAPHKDGIHFGPAGHEKIGAALYEQVFKSCR
jgi:lysophospholipase L1-like esterase